MKIYAIKKLNTEYQRKDTFMKPKLTVSCVLFFLLLSSSNAIVPSQSAEWFWSSEGRRIADNVLTWQTAHGSWPKNRDTMSKPFDGKSNDLHGTFDNGATTNELRFLARAFRATNEPRYQQAFLISSRRNTQLVGGLNFIHQATATIATSRSMTVLWSAFSNFSGTSLNRPAMGS